MQTPLVSVRLMVYNNEPYIREAVESILMQKTNFKVEIVVGDDFSTDNSLQIIKSYKDTENISFKILQREVGGEYWQDRQRFGRLHNFRNIIDNCSGKYIALLDGDDYWTDPLKLQKQVDFLEVNPDFSGVFHNVNFVNEINGGTSKQWRNYDYENTVFTEIDTIRILALFHSSSYLFRNQIKEFPDWFYQIFSGDMVLLTLISQNGKLKLIEGVMSVYRKNMNSITAKESIILYHKRRIKLIKHLNNQLNYAFNEKVIDVIQFHKKEIFKLKYPVFFRLKKRFMQRNG